LKANRMRPKCLAEVDVSSPPPAEGKGGEEWERHALALAIEHSSEPGASQLARFLLSRGAARRWTAGVFDAAIAKAVSLYKEDRGSMGVKYWLEVGKSQIPHAVMQREGGLERLQALPYAMVGQSAIKTLARDYINSFYMGMGPWAKKPLVLFLTGPPGHGKSALFSAIVDVLKLSSDPASAASNQDPQVPCFFQPMGDLKTLADLFTLGAAYADAPPTKFEDWAAANDGKRALVVFDEVDKLPIDIARDVLVKFFPMLEEGNLSVSQNKVMRSVSTKKFVVLFTANYAQETIQSWYDKEEKRYSEQDPRPSTGPFDYSSSDAAIEFLETLGKDVKGVVSGILGSMKGKGEGESGVDALISRIDA
jgi:hypothetical protein